MPKVLRMAAVTVLLAFAVPGVAAASPTWSTPDDLSATGGNAIEPQVTVDGQGNATAVWTRSNGTNTIVQSAGLDAAGPLLPFVQIPSAGTIGQELTFSVSPLDVWSPLGATSWDYGDGVSASGVSVTHTYAAPGSYTITLTSADALGDTSTLTVSSAPPPPPPPPPTPPPPAAVAPKITALTQSHRTWRTAKRAESIARKRAPAGTTFTLKLDQNARLTLTFSRSATGGHKKSVNAGSLTLQARKGKNTIRFSGQLPRKRTLKPGRYTATFTATNTAGKTSRPAKLTFTITRR